MESADIEEVAAADAEYSAVAKAAAAADRAALDAAYSEVIGYEGNPDADPEEPDESDPAYDESPWLKEALRRQQLEVPVPPSPVNVLLSKLDAWLMQQPEWFLILSAPRATRRKAITLISKHLLTYPARGRSFGGFTP